ncbi:unnamed protein product [Ectocarpus sp. CCAP 1310/34]|nr:unnamed protein product [Ectocarpus sp. CCAP 1310/34]
MVWGSLPPRVTRVAMQAGLRCARTGSRRSGGRYAKRGGFLSTAAKVPLPDITFDVESEPALPLLGDLPLLLISQSLACPEPEGDDDGDGR